MHQANPFPGLDPTQNPVARVFPCKGVPGFTQVLLQQTLILFPLEIRSHFLNQRDHLLYRHGWAPPRGVRGPANHIYTPMTIVPTSTATAGDTIMLAPQPDFPASACRGTPPTSQSIPLLSQGRCNLLRCPRDSETRAR